MLLDHHTMGCESSYTSSGTPSSTVSSAPSTPTCSLLSSWPTQNALRSLPKPHNSGDPLWAAICRRGAPVGPGDFHLLRRIGRGDTGTVYLSCLTGGEEEEVFAMKVVDRREVRRKQKAGRVEAERRVLRCLDHPFLPTLFAEFDASPHYSCAVIDFCSGGDLYRFLHLQPSRRFSVPSARFYAAEVLVALEYLHLHGIVYRDLKPENVLLRSDGHVMLSDFDLSFFSTANSPSLRYPTTHTCLPTGAASSTLPRLVAEPLDARSLSFVGTHEYVAPEVAVGREHGPAVDWWAFGVFLYELVYGRTPFVGSTNEATLRNVVEKPLAFPTDRRRMGVEEGSARDLMRKLLVKEPSRRLGAVGGAADVREHRFFRAVNFALLRSQRPPVAPAGAGEREKKPDVGRGT